VSSTRFAVVGHVDWSEFVRVARVPTRGEIVVASENWEEPGGGGVVAAVQLAELAGHCLFLTALAEDRLGRRSAELLAERGVSVRAAPRPGSQRRALVHVDDRGERTITVVGERMVPLRTDNLPWEALADVDALYFTGGDAEALRAARAARVLVATPRAADVVRAAGVELDALVGSGADPGERLDPAELEPPPRLLVSTLHSRGGCWRSIDGRTGAWEGADVIGHPVNSYGAGDCFAAALAYGLATLGDVDDAVQLAAAVGAAKVGGRGAHDTEFPPVLARPAANRSGTHVD
jgi:ribokinase